MTWDNFDTDSNYLKIEKARRKNVVDGWDEKTGKVVYKLNENGKKRVITRGLKNNEDSRTFDLEGCDIAIEILRRRRAAAAERQLATGAIEDRIFPHDVSKAWNRVVKCAGLRGADLPQLQRSAFIPCVILAPAGRFNLVRFPSTRFSIARAGNAARAFNDTLTMTRSWAAKVPVSSRVL